MSHPISSNAAVLIDINTLLPANSSFEILEAFSIDNQGQIVGVGFDPSLKAEEAYLLSPIVSQSPEPTSLFLLATIIAGVLPAVRHGRHHRGSES